MDASGVATMGEVEVILDLNPGDRITIVHGNINIGSNIERLTFIMDDWNVFGPFGGDGGITFEAMHFECYLASCSSGTTPFSITLQWKCP